MQINDKFFSFPPYLSTAWEHVTAITINETGHVVFHLDTSELISLPSLPQNDIEKIFQGHAAYLEKQTNKNHVPVKESPIRFAFGSPDGFSAAMQHNPAQSNAPPLPNEMLDRIAQISKALPIQDVQQLPEPEPHCNCYHCQIARTIQKSLHKDNTPELIEASEEMISDEELKFQQWDIKQTGDKLYTVSNKLDTNESYSVYLGHPVGCTCGKSGCEHILAVLKS